MGFAMSDTPPELDHWLTSTNEEYLKCRRWGHAWKEWRYVERPEEGVRSRTILRCGRCKQKAHDDMDYLGYALRTIQYEEDYLAPKGMGRLTREDRALLRLEIDERQKKVGTDG